MASKTTIANRALSKLGQPRVSNIATANTKAARIIDEMYDVVRDAMLTIIPWNFAVRRASLAPDGVAPAWGWTYAYSMPSDFLSLVNIKDEPLYEFENKKIMTDEGTTLYIKYIAQITNTGEFSPLFVEAFAARLAYEACEEVTQSNTKKQILGNDYDAVMDEATRVDAVENQSQLLEADSWLEARY